MLSRRGSRGEPGSFICKVALLGSVRADMRERARATPTDRPRPHTRARPGRGLWPPFRQNATSCPLSSLTDRPAHFVPAVQHRGEITTHTPLSPSQRAPRAPVSLRSSAFCDECLSGNTRKVFSEINQRAQARFARWDAKAPSHLQPQHQQPLSRHWIGGDLSRPAAVASQGRRETDVRESLPGCTLHHANKGFEKFQRFSHGTLDLIHARHAMKPVEEVMYDPPHHSPTRMPVQREGDASTANEPCFYLGDQPPPPSAAQRPAYLADTRPRRDDWRLGDAYRFTLDGSLQQQQQQQQRKPRLHGGQLIQESPVTPARHARRTRRTRHAQRSASCRRRRQPPRAQGRALG